MSYLQTAALFGTLVMFNLFVCLPILLSSSIKRLFNKLPTSKLILNYFLGMGVFSLLHSVLLLAVVVLSGGLKGPEALWGLGAVSVGTGLIAWIAISIGFTHQGWWQPKTKDELDGRIALALGLIWYTLSTVIGLLMLIVISIAFFFPG